MSMRMTAALVCVAGMTTAATAQDSVSALGTGLPGDAVNPFDPGEQCNSYRVDLAPGIGSWPGTRFGIAPLYKGSTVDPNFFTTILSAQAISTDLTVANPMGPYSRWHRDGGGSGHGVNPNANIPPNFPDANPANNLRQFGAGFAEFATDAGGANYEGYIGGVVQYDPTCPNSLLVFRNTAAVNEAAIGAGNTASFGFGSIDANGNLYGRQDSFGALGAPAVGGNNIVRVRTLDRDCAVVNQILGPGAAMGTDALATDTLVGNSATTYSTPTNVPASLAGGSGVMSALTFNGTLDYTGGGAVLSTTNYRLPLPNSRGTVYTTTHTFPALGGGVGGAAVATQACLLRDTADTLTTSLGVWGVDASGNVVSNLVFPLPGIVLLDNCANTGLGFPTGVGPSAAPTEFGHYGSQVPFRGGNGMVAVGRDPVTGEILIAAVVYDGDPSGFANNPVNAIVLARVDGVTGALIGWELVAYIEPNVVAGTHSPIYGDSGNDGLAFTSDPGEFDGVLDVNPVSPTFDAPIGELRPLFDVTGGVPLGPSISAPSFDSMGNLYFTSAVALNKFDTVLMQPFIDLDSALLKAHYDRQCGWRLERLLELGNTFKGRNSGMRYQVQFFGVADSNSVSTGAFWSGNVMSRAWNDFSQTALNLRNGAFDNAALGGMLLSAEIVYDADEDGDFEDPTGAGGNPASLDESYNSALFIGYRPCLADVTTAGAGAGDPLFGIPDESITAADIQFFVNLFVAGDEKADLTTAGAAVGTPLFRIPDGAITAADINLYVNDFVGGCDNAALNPADPVVP